MIVPPPQPVYTLSPDMDEIDATERAVLDRCLASLSGMTDGFVVTRIGRTHDHYVVDVETAHGPLLVLERRRAAETIADPRGARRAV